MGEKSESRAHLEVFLVVAHEPPQLALGPLPLCPPDKLKHARLASRALGRRRHARHERAEVARRVVVPREGDKERVGRA